MKVSIVRVIRDDCTDGKTCPVLADTDRGSCLVVGKMVRDPEALAVLAIGDDETVVEVPASLLGR